MDSESSSSLLEGSASASGSVLCTPRAAGVEAERIRSNAWSSRAATAGSLRYDSGRLSMETGDAGLRSPGKPPGRAGDKMPVVTGTRGIVGAVLASGQPNETLPMSARETDVALGTATAAKVPLPLRSALPRSALKSMQEDDGSRGMLSGQVASGESSMDGTRTGFRMRSGVCSCGFRGLLLTLARHGRLRALSAVPAALAAAMFRAGTLGSPLLTGCHLPRPTLALALAVMVLTSPVLAHLL